MAGLSSMKLVNLCPHAINVHPNYVIPPSGKVARVDGACIHYKCAGNTFVPKEAFLIDLPDPQQDVVYIVSGLCLFVANDKGRTDCVSPASNHQDAYFVDGHPVVPGFIRDWCTDRQDQRTQQLAW